MSQQFPKALVCSLGLLAATHLSGLSQMIVLVRNEDLGVSSWVLYSVVALLYCCIAALLGLVARGVDWARLVYALFGILSLFYSLPHLADLSALSRAVLSAKALGLVLLFVPGTNAWFRSRPNYSVRDFPSSLAK